MSCGLTPYFMAFPDAQSDNMQYLDTVMNIIFGMDIMVNFFAAYYDEDYQIVDDPKKIRWRYFSSWFFLDLLSIIPFDTIFTFGNVNKLTRFSRIGKMYKLIRFTKILRFVRLMKVKHKMVRHLGDMLKIGAGTERLIYLLITFFILQHVIACIWIFIARINDDDKENWIYHHGYIDSSNF